MTRRSKTPPPGSTPLFGKSAHEFPGQSPNRPGAASQKSAPPAGVHLANIDGASRGNPGPASYAVVLRDPAGKIILQLAKNLGRETNNVAEYYALLAALDYAATHGIQALRIRSDSELLVRQMQGRYKVKSADLKPLHERASKLARQLGYFAIEHVRREMNRDADALANASLNQAGVPRFEGRNVQPSSPNSPPSSRAIRAHYVNGVLVPFEPLDLAEGAEVSLDLRIPLKE
jgi:ribonuclease HI